MDDDGICSQCGNACCYEHKIECDNSIEKYKKKGIERLCYDMCWECTTKCHLCGGNFCKYCIKHSTKLSKVQKDETFLCLKCHDKITSMMI